MYGAVYNGRECTGWGVDTGGAKYGDFSYLAKFPEAKIPKASFPTANLFTANFPRTFPKNFQLTAKIKLIFFLKVFTETSSYHS